MVEFFGLDIEALLKEVKDRARSTATYSQEAWDDLVEEVLDEHLQVAEIDADEDVAQMREALRAGFKGFEEEIS